MTAPLTLTGTYILVMHWIRYWRISSTGNGCGDVSVVIGIGIRSDRMGWHGMGWANHERRGWANEGMKGWRMKWDVMWWFDDERIGCGWYERVWFMCVVRVMLCKCSFFFCPVVSYHIISYLQLSYITLSLVWIRIKIRIRIVEVIKQRNEWPLRN